MDYLIIYKYSLCVALTLILFLDFTFLLPQHLKNRFLTIT